MTAKMRENFASAMVPVACHVLDLKENVLNYPTHLMDKSILQEGKFDKQKKKKSVLEMCSKFGENEIVYTFFQTF
jgi:hypothetical protein